MASRLAILERAISINHRLYNFINYYLNSHSLNYFIHYFIGCISVYPITISRYLEVAGIREMMNARLLYVQCIIIFSLVRTSNSYIYKSINR